MGKVTKASNDDLHPHEILRQNLKKSSMQTKTPTKTKNVTAKKKVTKKYIHKCKFCDKKFTDPYNKKSHEMLHSTDLFPCPLCPYKGKTKKYLARHHKQVHSPPTRHKCHVCGKLFHHKCSLEEHIMVHTGEKPHKCDVCGKSFRVTYSLKSHMLIHKNEKPFRCSFCSYACRDSSTLRKHEHRHMGFVKMHTCKICSKKFPNRAKLKYHISEIHLDYLDLDLKRASCDKCSKTFRSSYNLNKHIQAVHDKSLSCECPVCGRRLSNKQNLPTHLRTHFDERPHACAHRGCGKTFKDKGAVKKHSMIHATHLHAACRICGATFSRAYRLERHMRTHEPREKSVECAYCGVAFYSKNYLIKHITSKHSENRLKFICDLCGLVAYNKPSLIMHLKYGHQYDRDLFCKICKTVYKRHEYLKAHYLRTHNVKYKPRKRLRKDSKPTVEVKVEPIDPEPFGEIQLLTVYKEEIIDEEDPSLENDLVHYSKQVLSEDLAECLLNDQREAPENTFDEFLYQHVFHKRIKEDVTQDEVDKEQEELVTEKIKEIIKNTKERETAERLERKRKKDAKLLEKKLKREAKLMRKKKGQEIYELEKVRQMYNERMREAANEAKKKEPAKTIKYFKQKTTDKTNTVEETNKTRNHSIDNSMNLGDSIGNENHSNDTNSSSEVNLEKAPDVCQNGDAINDASDEICEDSGNQMIDSKDSDDIKEINDVSKNNHANETVPDKYCLNYDKVVDSNVNKIVDSDDDEVVDLNDSKVVDINDDRVVNLNDDKVVDLNDDKVVDLNDDRFVDPNCDKVVDLNVYEDDACTKDDQSDDANDDDGNSDADSDYEPHSRDCSDDESAGKKRLKFKTHQCYICFKLYPTKEDLISHCSTHFSVCNARTLVKCPVCGHVAHAHMAKHMLKEHDINVTIPFNKIMERKDNSEGSRYCYKMDDTIMEIIPSVKVLNNNASMQIDKRNRERRDKTIAKTRLVKKGKEWIVENVAVDVSFTELPQFTEQELNKLEVTSSYADRLGQLNRLAKKKGIKMLFPCNRCEKICQNLSALKLHGRRHDPNKKPFAPRKNKRNEKLGPTKKKPEVTNLENRLAKPKPIKNKHKCDEELKKFYETHIRGADIEFWQFLKIFNKMDRENIQDFKDFEGRTEFGIHTNEDRTFNDPKVSKPSTSAEVTSKNTVDKVQVSKSAKHVIDKSTTRKVAIKRSGHCDKQIKKSNYKRVIMISRKQHMAREKAKMELRGRFESIDQ